MRRLIVLFVVALGFAAEHASAQEGALSRLYGQGVHAYFGGNLTGAEKLFTQAIQGGSEDPRLHYFRGLIYLRSGRRQAAAAEFEQGAELEVGATRSYDVSMALERIQGRPRLALEEHRAARLAAGTSATRTQRRNRLEMIQRREPETTVPPTPNTLDAITGDAVPVPATQPEVSAPFADPMEAASEKAAPPVPATEEAAEDPFGADETAPADTDAVPAEATAEEPEATAPEPATEEAEDPFGGDETTPPAETAPAPTNSPPANEESPPAADDSAPADEAQEEDPFGGDEAPADKGEAAPAEPPANTPPATEAADEEDPFGS